MSAEAKEGAKIFKSKCALCHTIEEGGAHKQGPNLHGVFGRKAGTKEGYAYSAAIRASGVVWGEEALSEYLLAPKKFIESTRKVFSGLKKQPDRSHVIAYLKEFGGGGGGGGGDGGSDPS